MLRNYTDGTVPIPDWTIGDRLRKARRSAGIERIDLAADIGCTTKTLGNYENDITRVPRLVVERYATRTGLAYSWLITGIVPPGGFPPNTPASECYPGLRAA